ncbi:DNA polymerase [Nitrosomonas sp.]|uniref:DNA polymerase n=1 Tax=Nitrosomonas sp. TaxID=42353 RepID=UPI00260F8DE5|nr:DNA polymerase [Nitrosomonas sp.]MCW5601398.1 bifunctional DNA primase/polymerase [Nitrosomonas sp.]
MNLLEAALNYAGWGIPVFPVHGISDNGACTCGKPTCVHPGKHPILDGGYKNATCDQQQIIEWWNKYPKANIGIPTGKVSGWYAVDVDKKNNGIKNYREFLNQHETAIPKASLKVNTGGGGYHLIYAKPANGQTVKSTTSIGRMEGVDFRGEGGYIVAPPSLHYSQENYQWARGFSFDGHYDPAQLVPLPALIVDLVNNPTRALVDSESIPQGSRNSSLFKLACQFRRGGVADEQLFELVSEKNASLCKPPLDQSEVRQIVTSALKTEITPRDSAKGTGKAVTTSGRENNSDDVFDKLISLTAEHEFWVDESKKQYVTFKVDNKPTNGAINNEAQQHSNSHYENWPIKSQEYRLFLSYKYRQRYGKVASTGNIEKVLQYLESEALIIGSEHKTHVRCARTDDRVFIDLTNSNWEWIEITAAGWCIRSDKTPVKFLRSTGAKPMFTPDPSGSFDCLPDVFRLKSQDDYILLAGWMEYSLVEGGPYPVLILEGPAGTSKSTLTKQIRQVIDPRKPALQGMPRNIDDLFIQANNGYLIAIDNLSEIRQGLSDVLCGISSGTGGSKRQLYTDSGEIYYEVCRPLILNSINPVADSPDLVDRSIRLSLPSISSKNGKDSNFGQRRLSAEEVEVTFQQVGPKILGAICNAIQAALPNYRQVKDIPDEIRMIDFARWGYAAGETLGASNKDFIRLLLENRQHNAAPLMENDVLNQALLRFMQKKIHWSGSPTDLYKGLEKEITPEEKMDKSFPKIPSHLTRHLNKSIPTLKQYGIEYHHDASSHKNRKISLNYNPKDYDSDDAGLPVTWGYPTDDMATDSDSSDDNEDPEPVPNEIVNQPVKPYRVIGNLEDMVYVLDELAAANQLVGLDIETTGLNPRRDKICLIQLSSGLETVIFDVRRHDDLSALKEPLERIHAVAHNAVFEMSFLQMHGISLKLECTQLAHHVLTGDCKSLKDLSKDYLHISLDKTQQTSDWSGDHSEDQLNYAAQDAEVVLLLFNTLKEKLQERDVMAAYERVRNAQPFVVAMQLNGINIDQTGYRTMLDDLKVQYNQLKQQWEEQVPGVNFNSPQQLSNWIARGLLKSEDDWPKTDSGHYSTSTSDIQLNKAKLNSAAIAVVDTLLLPLKQVSKKISAFGDQFLNYIDKETGKIYPSYNLAGTVTGRMSCSKPNLQQIPRDERYRKMFHAPVGYKLVIADYSQMELRIAAIIADEGTLLDAYQQGRDTHQLTAALILGKKPEDVSKEERQLAKAVNFGLLYGQGAAGLQEYASNSYGVDISMHEAEEYRAAWFESYPTFAHWHQQAWDIARQTMMVSTPGGRKRYFENADYNHPKGLRKPRVYNTPIQGGAAEVLLEAMARVSNAIEEQGYTDTIRPIAVIHDEIILMAREDCAENAKQLLENAMVEGMLAIFPEASTIGLVEAHIGDSWADK